jgi:hypothetical protein
MAQKQSESSARAAQRGAKGDAMAIVRFREDEIPPPTPEEMAHYRALAERPDDEIDFSDIPEMTDEDWARSVRVSDYASAEEAMQEARHLSDMQKAGMSIEELEAYKASRIRQAIGV